MFRQLTAALVTNPADPQNWADTATGVLTEYRPSQLSEFLELVWNRARNPARQLALGAPNAAIHQAMARPNILDPIMGAIPQFDPARAQIPGQWQHIVYALMLENVRIVEIFRRVIYEWTHGERLPPPTQATQRWIHVTEQLFFPLAPVFTVRAVTSTIRPDAGGVRRNAYYRLLGMDVNHGLDDGRPYPYAKADAANRDFAMVFETLLSEVWLGYTNRYTTVAENRTDNNAIMNLVRRIREMLQSRRNGGALSREEFEAVAMLSWFHLTVEYNTGVVINLNAQSDGISDRVKRIGDLVGLPAHVRSDSYFQLATRMSVVLLAIENNTIATAPDLYADNGFLRDDMLEIITHWSIATGRNLKDPALRQSIGVLAGTGAAGRVAVGNGAGAISQGIPVNRLAGMLR